MDEGQPVVEITLGRRYFLFAIACSHVLMATGECYGWTALRPVLLDSGLFKDSTAIERAQLMNAVATMGIAANALCKLPLGYVLDR